MTKINIDDFKQRVGILLRKYKKQLLISKSWKITYEVRPRNLTDYAEVEYDYDKREFVIYINKALNIEEKDLKDTIIHELFHIFLSPYTDLAGKVLEAYKTDKPIKYAKTKKQMQDTEEKLVQKLTKIILNLEMDI